VSGGQDSQNRDSENRGKEEKSLLRRKKEGGGRGISSSDLHISLSLLQGTRENIRNLKTTYGREEISWRTKKKKWEKGKSDTPSGMRKKKPRGGGEEMET